VLTFTSDAFSDVLDLAGPIVAWLGISASSASTHVAAKLTVVDPSGRTRRISEGIALVTGAQSEQRVAVGLGSTGFRVQRGCRLRLEIASSDYPQHLPHPGSEGDPWTTDDVRTATQRLRVGGAHGSRLELTVLP
jgi:uncharacterized protein